MIIYTDGACSSTDKTGGWATVIVAPQQIPNITNVHLNIQENCVIISSNAHDTTNNIMELTAVLYAMKTILTTETEDTSHIIYTDSAYVANCFNAKWYEKWQGNGWITASKQPVANKELWQEILSLYKAITQKQHTIDFCHVKGHESTYYNNIADSFAVSERLALRR